MVDRAICLIRWWLLVALLVAPCELFADRVEGQEGVVADGDRLMTLPPRFDMLLFRSPRMSVVDIFGEATTYYHPQISTRARGLDWWVADELFAQPFDVGSLLMVGDGSRVRLSTASSDYRYGVLASRALSLFDDWYLEANLDLRFGRSAFVDGVFRRDLRPNVSLSKIFALNHYLTVEFDSPLLMRGLQSGASSEAFELTGDRFYNPSWGLYDGEVRNARVRRIGAPRLSGRYQRPLREGTVVEVAMEGGYARRSTSQLGWFDTYSPLPDYYRKMPSYLPHSSVLLEVDRLWRSSDIDYTQIDWDRLVEINQWSPSGSAHYVLEDLVSSSWDVDAEALVSSKLSQALELTYGVAVYRRSSRCFKELSDLLGGDYLLDIDLYIDDFSHTNSGAQSDLRNPDREVAQGERFGYDYTMFDGSTQALLGVHHRGSNLEVVANCRFGDQYIYRRGHYENGRFEGALSYGDSRRLTLPHYDLDANVIYTLGGGHHLALRGCAMTLRADGGDMFIQEESANRLVDSPVAERLSMLSLRYSYMSESLSVDVDGYILTLRDGSQTWRMYDDLSYTYSDCVVSQIGSRSIGLDVVCSYDLSREVNLDLAVAAGVYKYDVSPLVTLYDDMDISKYSASRASAVEGCVVGNAPQVVATSSLTYFVRYGLILSADCSYAACRYISPSFVRRTDRVVRGVSSPELRAAIVDQQRLDDAFDLSLSVVRSYWLSHDRRLSLTARVDNILGTTPPVDYAREGNRVLSHSGGSTTSSYYLQSDSYTYGSPRTFYISCNYYF